MWWNSKYGKDKVCSITHCRLRAGGNCVFLKCGHGFYKNALSSWIDVKVSVGEIPSCPSCRKLFDPIDIFLK